jgi:hypothetical protein
MTTTKGDVREKHDGDVAVDSCPPVGRAVEAIRMKMNDARKGFCVRGLGSSHGSPRAGPRLDIIIWADL